MLGRIIILKGVLSVTSDNYYLWDKSVYKLCQPQDLFFKIVECKRKDSNGHGNHK